MSNQLETRTRSLTRRLLDVVGVWLALAAGVLVLLLLLRAGYMAVTPPRPTYKTF